MNSSKKDPRTVPSSKKGREAMSGSDRLLPKVLDDSLKSRRPGSVHATVPSWSFVDTKSSSAQQKDEVTSQTFVERKNSSGSTRSFKDEKTSRSMTFNEERHSRTRRSFKDEKSMRSMTFNEERNSKPRRSFKDEKSTRIFGGEERNSRARNSVRDEGSSRTVKIERKAKSFRDEKISRPLSKTMSTNDLAQSTVWDEFERRSLFDQQKVDRANYHERQSSRKSQPSRSKTQPTRSKSQPGKKVRTTNDPPIVFERFADTPAANVKQKNDPMQDHKDVEKKKLLTRLKPNMRKLIPKLQKR